MNIVRAVLIVAVLLSLTWFQPTASAEGCKIDLSDPTEPQIYGDCIGLTHGVYQSEDAVGADVGVSSDVGVSDPTGFLCSSRTCRIGIDQQFHVEVDPDDPTAAPEAQSGSRLNVTNEEGDGDCLVQQQQQVGGIEIVGCLPAP